MSKFDIAAAMNGIITSPAHQSIFAKPEPQFTKTAAAKKDDDKAKADKEKAKAKAEAEKEKEKAAKEKAKEKAEKEKAKEKAEKEKAKAKAAKKKAMTKYESCIYNLYKASEILDEAGLSKASALALLALDDLVKTAAKKKEEKEKGKDKKEDAKKKEEEKKAAEKKKEEAKKKEDKADAKGLPPWLKNKKDDKKDGKKEEKKDGKKDEKKDVKKDVKKKAQFQPTPYPGDPLDPTLPKGKKDVLKVDDCGMAEDTDDNKEFEDLMRQLEEPSEGEGDWEVLNQPAHAHAEGEEDGDLDLEDPELESLVEGIGPDGEEPDLDELTRNVASKKTSLQKLAEELASGFLA